MRDYKTQSVETAFDGKRCKIERHKVDCSGDGVDKTLTFEVCKVRDAVAVLPYLSDGHVLVLENYRYPVGENLIELVAGLVEPGEDIAAAAARECEEECGYVPKGLEQMGVFYTSPGLSTERIHLYRAYNLKKSKQQLEDMEDLRVEAIMPFELIQMLNRGKVVDMKTALAIKYLEVYNLKGTMGIKE